MAESSPTEPSITVRIGNFFFRYRDGVVPVVLLTLFVLTRNQGPVGGEALDDVLDGVGLLVAAAGQALRAAVIGYKYIVRAGGRAKQVNAEDLVTSGFFGVSRNPLYVGNVLIYVGLLAIWNRPWMYVIGGGFVLVLYRTIVAAEEEFLRRRFGPAYDDYCRDVPRWIPDLRRLSGSLEGMSFNWRRVLLKDYGTVVAWVATALVLLMIETTRGPTAGPEVRVWTLAGLLAAVWVFWGVVRWLKLTKRMRA